MNNDTIMLIGGLVIGLIVVVSAVTCYFVIKKQKSVNADYNKSSVAERKILENDTYDYSEVINTREFTAMITSKIGRSYTLPISFLCFSNVK